MKNDGYVLSNITTPRIPPIISFTFVFFICLLCSAFSLFIELCFDEPSFIGLYPASVITARILSSVVLFGSKETFARLFEKSISVFLKFRL